MISLKEVLFPPWSRGKPTRRRNKRIRHRFAVDCSAGSKELRELSTTLSAGGLFVSTAEPFPLKTRLKLTIALSENKRDAVEAHGIVVHHQSRLGMGVRFTQIEPEDRKRIKQLIDRCWWQEV